MTSPTTQVNSSRSARENSSSSDSQSFALLIRRTVRPVGRTASLLLHSSSGEYPHSQACPLNNSRGFLLVTVFGIDLARWSNDYRRSVVGYERVAGLKLRSSPPVAVDGACLPVGHRHPYHRLAAGFPIGLVARRNPDATPRLGCRMAGFAP